MISTMLRWIMFGSLLFTTCIVHGEGGCPPGFQPTGVAPSPQSPVPCRPIQDYGQQQARRPPPPPLFAAFAVDSQIVPYFGFNYLSEEAAESAVLAACNANNGKKDGNCSLLGWFSNECGTFAVDQSGKTYFGYSPILEWAAIRAMMQCNADTESSKCTLVSLPICAGTPNAQSAFNDANNQTPEVIEAISATLDTRDYWGSFASDGEMINGSSNLRTQSSAESKALVDCKGCRVALSFKNSCGSIAWPLDGRKVYETGKDIAPNLAKEKALAKCEKKYGPCKVATRCSGRAYPNPNPDAPADAPKPHEAASPSVNTNRS